MESWTPREAARYTPPYFLFVLAVVTVLELLFSDSSSGVADTIVSALPLAVGMAFGLAFLHIARWHYERKAA
jgi:hypothetical protein